MHFGPQILFLIKSSYMAQRGGNLMALGEDYVVDAAELELCNRAPIWAEVRGLCSIMQKPHSSG
jgi:hypothetical protein